MCRNRILDINYLYVWNIILFHSNTVIVNMNWISLSFVKIIQKLLKFSSGIRLHVLWIIWTFLNCKRSNRKRKNGKKCQWSHEKFKFFFVIFFKMNSIQLCTQQRSNTFTKFGRSEKRHEEKSFNTQHLSWKWNAFEWNERIYWNKAHKFDVFDWLHVNSFLLLLMLFSLKWVWMNMCGGANSYAIT